jgi:16S rRNA (cytosine1402-N4)-methyltransferase
MDPIKKVHIPVLLEEILTNVPLNTAKVITDCTVGLGGHSYEMMKRAPHDATLIAFDQDQSHIKLAQERLQEFKDRTIFIHNNFENLLECVVAKHMSSVDIILFDLGIASPHVDLPERGFSYRYDGPLDMRLNNESNADTAADIINNSSESDLKYIFRRYGEENRARKVAEVIVQRRKEKPFTRTTELTELIQDLSHTSYEANQICKRVFQALRIKVNRELETLENVLVDAINLLNVGGRIAVISYHSLEDRIVKNAFKRCDNSCHCPKTMPVCQCHDQQKLKIITKKPIIPSDKEIADNPRSRSAKLRIVEKLLPPHVR